MSQLNLKQILSGDNLSTVVDKLNYNFDQIILNGGGPQGLRGIIGAPGLPGAQGIQGKTGPTGPRGNYIFADGATPGDYPFGTGGETLPILGDLYIETDPTFLNIYELSPTGSTGTYWNLIETISAPSSAFIKVEDGFNDPLWNSISNDPTIAPKVFIGSTGSFEIGAIGDPNYFFKEDTPNYKFQDALSSGVSFWDSVLSVAGSQNQLRILSNGLDGATGSLGATGTSPFTQTNRGGIVHSLQPRSGGGATVQAYIIRNADTNGEKFFSLNLNHTISQPLLYGDMNNRAGIRVSPFSNTMIASLNVGDSLAIGSDSFWPNVSFSANQGVITEGNLAVGTTGNEHATGTFHTNGIFAPSSLLVDTDGDPGNPNTKSRLTLGSGIVQNSANNKNYWDFEHDGGSFPFTATPRSLTLRSFSAGLTATGVTSSRSLLFAQPIGFLDKHRHIVGWGNTDPWSQFEVGYSDVGNLTSRISIGEVGSNTFPGVDGYGVSYIGFNLGRRPTGIANPWQRRGDGAYNAGQAIWSRPLGGFHFSFFGSTGGNNVFSSDSQVANQTRLTIKSGSIISSDIAATQDLTSFFGSGITGMGLYVGFGASGTTGSGLERTNWRRKVAMFGATSSLGSPAIYTTNGATQSTAFTSTSESVLPHYTFHGSEGYGLYLAEGTTANSVVWGTQPVSIGLAVGGTSAISVQGPDTRVGIDNRNPLERVHIGEMLVYHDSVSSSKFIGFNIFRGSGGQNFRIKGSNLTGATQYGYVRMVFNEVGLTSTSLLSGFTNVGTRLELDLGNLGGTSVATSSPLSTSGRNYRGVIFSPPPIGPVTSAGFIPQLGIGVYLPTTTEGTRDSLDSGKRGTLAIAAQSRSKGSGGPGNPPIFEDLYNIGLYDHLGFPSVGIRSQRSSLSVVMPEERVLEFNFLGDNGLALTEDLSILKATLNGSDPNLLTLRHRRIIQFGDSFRVGINDSPNILTSTISPTVGYDIAPLTVAGATAYYSANPQAHYAGLFRGSVVVDQTSWNPNSGGNEALFFKHSGITGSNTRLVPQNSNSYMGDWGIQYSKNNTIFMSLNPQSTNSNMGDRAGLAIRKPGGSEGVAGGQIGVLMWLDDGGAVSIGTSQFRYTPAGSGTDQRIDNIYATIISGNNALVTNAATNSAYTSRLAVAGDIYCTGIHVASDMRLKEELGRIDTSKALDAIQKLSPVLFKWKNNEKVASGFFAQEVEKILPEAVFTVDHEEFEDGQRVLEIWPFVSALTGAIQEQQNIINEKDTRIKNLEDKLSKIEELLAKHNIS